ncbi:ADP-heptose--LPS heptosyltransferase [Lawsonia intracellularis]|uniref:ADP-heptose:LPS heptosyltransferase n=1 Tax=Lawsonia intracellularis (strain PHE/MN1-00) TaxID=363253 RepID=Q1MQV4_LAWIP|nr:ADP-heptose--LPS heptosyltransferase [Lawsonia intracellularis]AGC49986.1 glycosyltransferase [Lawsonia intracellularis N343]KAA0204684.1 ADP-heptose--LPS heptosyltransferase [Lawsonia intracellularis]MBZ3893049.1 ADP-heptose--LPS heptosyltransferase [Lawsonia intracellularis]RBN33403.1 ADP-heptose--LPS heptosyltransferase [Lawsonia intracellularis]RBN34773.1 ADP-heptose--LPS heptosyltransferase [Lawsonia intracellularis]
MTQSPTLIIQLQRMGDLILSFHLCKRLLMLEPNHPLWVLAEPHFFKELITVAPQVVFFDHSMIPNLKLRNYRRVINLSHRDIAAQLTGVLTTEEKIGIFNQEDFLYIAGDWRLYRSSIVNNNRHNLFHWSDLEALGLIPEQSFKEVIWPPLRNIGSSGHIGLFVGASEAGKRPNAQFWGLLARYLIRHNLYPIFLGGPNDRSLAQECIDIAQLNSSNNFAGKFNLSELVLFSQKLDLFVTPDTGPMHLAAWTGTPVLNLSMGNVNPWETAPASPGHIVVRPAMSCVGCWNCEGRDFSCRSLFTPGKIGRLIVHLIENSSLEKSIFSGLHIYKTSRDERGLFTLVPLLPNIEHQRHLLGLFWKEWFIAMLGGMSDKLIPVSKLFFENAPHMCNPMQKTLLSLSKNVAKVLKKGSDIVPSKYWFSVMPALRPATGYIDLLLQNNKFSNKAWKKTGTLLSSLIETFSFASQC